LQHDDLAAFTSATGRSRVLFGVIFHGVIGVIFHGVVGVIFHGVIGITVIGVRLRGTVVT